MVNSSYTRHRFTDGNYSTRFRVQKQVRMQSSLPYREMIGTLLWIENGTRPDISYAVGTLAKYTNNPRTSHIPTANLIPSASSSSHSSNTPHAFLTPLSISLSMTPTLSRTTIIKPAWPPPKSPSLDSSSSVTVSADLCHPNSLVHY